MLQNDGRAVITCIPPRTLGRKFPLQLIPRGHILEQRLWDPESPCSQNGGRTHWFSVERCSTSTWHLILKKLPLDFLDRIKEKHHGCLKRLLRHASPYQWCVFTFSPYINQRQIYCHRFAVQKQMQETCCLLVNETLTRFAKIKTKLIKFLFIFFLIFLQSTYFS